MAIPGLAPRNAAAVLLRGVLEDHLLMSELVSRRDSPLSVLVPQEKARAQTLATTVLRHLGRLDIVLDQFLQKPPPPAVRNALRIAAAEIIIDDIAPHAAVDAAVNLVRSNRKTQHLKGLTNAVARRVAEHGREIWQDLEPQELPDYLRKPLVKTYGESVVTAIESAHEAGACVDLTVKKQEDIERWAADLNAEILPSGSLRLGRHGQISQLAGFEDGAWWVQDAAAAIPVRLLGDVAGAQVLDLCAAPGGKTLQLAAAGADVTAIDISKYRLKRLKENLQRTELKAEIVAADVLRWSPKQQYDAILLDAPCSASGTIRRHPDLPFLRSSVDLAPLLKLQAAMLRRALIWLKPGGKLVYATCSLLPEEGESQVQKTLAMQKTLDLIPADPKELGLLSDWATSNGALRLRPDFWHEKGGMDGFYIACIGKN